jgi:hypothetical protein
MATSAPDVTARVLAGWIVTHGGIGARPVLVELAGRWYPGALYTGVGQYAPLDYLYVVARRLPLGEYLSPVDAPETVYLPVRQHPRQEQPPCGAYRCYVRVPRTTLPTYLETLRERPVQIRPLPGEGGKNGR